MSATDVDCLIAGDSNGDDPSSNHGQAMKSLHELDAVVPSVASGSKRPAASRNELLRFPFQCPICKRTLYTETAVHVHMLVHWERGWGSMELPWYVCDRCRSSFDTKQGLGGHRASHNGRKGCSWLAKQEELAEAAAAAEAPRPVVFHFDLNQPAAEAQEEEQQE